ncbi:MAG: S8 family peptidase [Flavobacteriia bacterium]|nr:S8 family peptidase [Flavobacteriia bacterium]
MKKIVLFFNLFFLINTFYSQSNKFGFELLLKEEGSKKMPFAIDSKGVNLEDIKKNNQIKIKKSTENYIYVTCTPTDINQLISENKINDFYFSSHSPVLLNDSSRAMHFVNEVHSGQSPLTQAYTGKNVIIGYIDTGCDYQHPDFKDENGNSRIIRYWDHNMAVDPERTPEEYGYGQIFDSIDLNDTLLPLQCNIGHGTTVAGAGSGGGLANGTNAGMAPESKIIIVDFNFDDGNNWTLRVADACDYIFKIADQYGLPAVINISLGSYFGSHDGEDPASELMNTLLDEKEGRIILSSAGNGGDFKNFHVHNVVTSTPSFIWLANNPAGAFGTNSAFFDLWGNQSEVFNINYSFSAINPNSNYETRGQTNTYNVLNTLGTEINEYILSPTGDTIALIDIYSGPQANAYNMFAHIKRIDSTNYYISFNTSGSGVYDAWTGANYGDAYQIVENIPDVLTYPNIVNYVLPDSLQSIVSDWNCSDKIVSVANLRNRVMYIDNNGDLQDNSAVVPPRGALASSSSIGPTRTNIIKPEISASGDGSFAPAPLCILENPAQQFKVLQGGWFARNGGTSMASPVVAGIAALYLEKCPLSTYQDFKDDLINTAFTDQYTGTVPNFAYGYGKAHAFNLLLETNFNIQISGPNELCIDPIVLGVNTSETIENYLWSTGESTSQINVSSAQNIELEVVNNKGCKSSASKLINQLSPINPTISINSPDISVCEGDLVSLYSTINGGGVNPQYSWYVNGVPSGSSPNFSSSSLTNNDIISCELISSETCTIENPVQSNEIVLEILPITSPTVNISASDVEICPEEIVTFTSTVQNIGQNADYNWFWNGVLTGDNSPTIEITGLLNGDYVYCKILTDNECANENTDISNIIIFEVYGNAVIDQFESGLMSVTEGSAYQWYSCETMEMIEGANQQIFYPSQAGSYYVVVTFEGCVSTSNCMSTNQLSNSEITTKNNISVFPNPFSNSVQIFNNTKTNQTFIITNTQGQKIQSLQINGNTTKIVDLSSLASGIYYMENKGQDINVKLVKL